MANGVGIQVRCAFVRQDSDQNSSLNANCKSRLSLMVLVIRPAKGEPMAAFGDRKSTRLNSSHLVISYAVFCLKKKKKENYRLNACCLSSTPLDNTNLRYSQIR